MNDSKLLKQIGDLIDEKLKPVRDQLDIVELKVETVNKRVEQAQEETIGTLSDLIHAGYDMHEKRIKKLEDQSSLS